MSFSYHTDSELERFVENNPGHFEAEGELVRRVLAGEWQDVAHEKELDDLTAEHVKEIDDLCAEHAAEMERLEQRVAELEAASEAGA